MTNELQTVLFKPRIFKRLVEINFEEYKMRFRYIIYQGRKMFQIPTRPSLPAERIYLSSGLNVILTIAPE